MAEPNEVNGITDKFIQQALTEVEQALKSKRLSSLDRIVLVTHRSVLYFIRDERSTIQKLKEDIKEVRDNSVLLWVKKNKVAAGLIISALLVLNSYWNWAGLRQEWLGPLLNALGIPIVKVP